MQWINNLCRLCGKIGEICYDVFDENSAIREKVLKYLKIKICKEDYKPKEICNICYDRINDFDRFAELCLEMDSKFESMACSSIEPHKQSVIVSNKGHTSELQEAENYLTNKQLISVQEIQQSITTNCSPTSTKKGKSYPCPHCKKTFKRKINLTAHISLHTNIRQFKCSTCPKTFAVKSLLTQHNKTHSEQFECTTCQKRFQVPSKLARHLHTHTSNKPFECHIADCNKAFSDKHNLNQHVLSHLPDKSLPCQICQKMFKTKKNLSAHLKSHSSEKVFQCSYCEKKFRYKHNLKVHFAVKHKK